MEQKTQNYITIGSFLVAFAGFGFTLYTRTQDQHAEFYEKEQQYRAKTLQSIQSIKEIHKNELQAHKNEFQEYKLKSQELNFQQEKKIENLEEKVAKKNEVLGELMEAHIELKKSLGED